MVDLRMPDVNGLDLLRQIRATVPSCEVILMTGFAAVDSAVEAIKLGARDYLPKPFDFDRLRRCSLTSATSSNAARGSRAREPGRASARVLRHARPQSGDAGGLQPHSAAGAARQGRAADAARPARARSWRRARFIRPGRGGPGRSSPSTARRSSTRCSRASCSATCAARSPARSSRRRALFEAAQRGTLFLDEIGELPHRSRRSCCARSKTGKCSASGRSQPSSVDVAVIAATNRDLRAEVGGRALPRRPVLPAQRRRASCCRRCATGARTSRT